MSKQDDEYMAHLAAAKLKAKTLYAQGQSLDAVAQALAVEFTEKKMVVVIDTGAVADVLHDADGLDLDEATTASALASVPGLKPSELADGLEWALGDSFAVAVALAKGTDWVEGQIADALASAPTGLVSAAEAVEYAAAAVSS
ncbi:MAG: hypothetical protein M0Z36_05380 [Thermaerobacter sp.]|nr:hypothetical protein [Thermaerobacter sp.]